MNFLKFIRNDSKPLLLNPQFITAIIENKESYEFIMIDNTTHYVPKDKNNKVLEVIFKKDKK